LPEIFAQHREYPTGETDPADSEISSLVEGQQTRDLRGTTMVESYRRHDLYLSIMRGGPGLGDPLEREIADVQRDLDEGLILPRFAEGVYGVAVGDENGQASIDAEASERSRQEALDRRAANAIPAKEWIARERQDRVLPQRLIGPVRDMYRSSMELSPRWARMYRDFWDLDQDFEFSGDER
jgi:N-methylhydantoinase B/acetone carboxylase alpha subunit